MGDWMTSNVVAPVCSGSRRTRRPSFSRRALPSVLVLAALAAALQLWGAGRADAALLGRIHLASIAAEAHGPSRPAEAPVPAAAEGSDWFPLVAVGAAVVAMVVAFGLVASSAARLRRMQWSFCRRADPAEASSWPDPDGVRHTVGIQI